MPSTNRQEKIRFALNAAKECAEKLVKAGLPRSRAVQVAARAASRIIRPPRGSVKVWTGQTGLGATFETQHHGTLWAAGGGGSTVHSLVRRPTPPTPPTSEFVDNLADPAFVVTSPTDVPVAGGGGALAAAVVAAAPGTRLLITDSLDYSVVNFSGKTDITIEAASGQTPTITAVAGAGGHCVEIGAGNSGIRLKGLHLIGNGNLNALSFQDNGLILGTAVTGMTASTFDRLIVEDCLFTDLNPASGVPGVQLIGTDGTVHTSVQIIRCTFTDMSTPAFGTGVGYGAITIGGFNFVFVQNTKIERVAVARATSNMRGVVLKNVTSLVQDVLCFDIGTGGSCESFKHNNEAAFGSVVGGDSTWQNCVGYNSRRGFRCTQAAATMNIEHGTIYIDTVGIAAGQTIIQQSSGTVSFVGSVIEGAGDGTAFTATLIENQNDVFNVGATGKVLDATDLTVDPVLTNTAINDYRATAAGVTTGAPGGTPMGVYYPGGTEIFWAGVP